MPVAFDVVGAPGEAWLWDVNSQWIVDVFAAEVDGARRD